MKKIARNTDPVSSHEAAEELTDSGKRENQNATVTELVKNHPGFTSLELSRICDLDRYQLARRLADCDRLTVKKGAIRRCTIGKRSACTWYPL